MNVWNPVCIGDLISSGDAEVQTGPFGTQLNAGEYVEEGVPVINVRNIGFGKLSDGKLEYVNEVTAHRLGVHWLKENDIVFCRKGAVDRHLLVPKGVHGWIQGSDCMRLRINSDSVDSKFLSYYFLTSGHKDWMEAQCSFGATMSSLNQGVIRRITFLLPPLSEQRKIAAILSAYDDLIENNTRRIALLEKMAEEVYREWFVRLRFPGHESVPVHQGVPGAWEVKRVDDMGRVVTGKTPSTENPRFYGGGIPFIKTPDMHGNMFVHETIETLTDEGMSSQPSQIIPRHSICVSCIGTGGIVSMTTAKSQTNQQINSVVLNYGDDLEWAFFTLRGLEEMIKSFGSTGATMTNLSKNKFAGLLILLPPREVRSQYHSMVNPLFGQIESLALNNIRLRKTRDSLLSRLLSGKLAVENLDVRFPVGMK